MKKTHQTSKNRRNIRSRRNIFGINEKPRICVFRSNTHLYVQAIDDKSNRVLASASTLKINDGTKTVKAVEVGNLLAEKLKELKIQNAVFDRNGYKYHGRVKALADSIREKGIIF